MGAYGRRARAPGRRAARDAGPVRPAHDGLALPRLEPVLPRAGILAFWIFSSLLGRAYDSWIVPVIGFFVLPCTTLAYATTWGWSSHRVAGVEWIVVAVALGLDVATYAGWRRLRS
jgi:hypothetical protein